MLNGIPNAPSIIYNNSEPAGDQTVSIADLTPAYAFPSQAASRVWRGTKLFNNRVWLMVQDEIVSATGQNVWWFAHFSTSGTTWSISTDGSSVTLTNGGNRLWTKLLTPGASFAISNCVPLPTSPNPTQIGIVDNLSGYRKLALNLTGVTNPAITVMMVPLLAGDSPPQRFPAVVPLANWPTNDITLITNTPPVANNGSATVTNNINYFNFDLRTIAGDANTPSNLLLFAISQVSTGSVSLLGDGHTVQFAPPANYSGTASFNYSVNDQWLDQRLLFYFDFQAANWTNFAEPNDVSGRWHDGTFDTSGGGVYSNTPTAPGALAQFLAQSARFVGGTSSGARLTRGISTPEWNCSQTNWTFTGWFRCESLAANNYIFYIGNGSGTGGSGDELVLYADTSRNLILKHWNTSSANDLTLTASGVVNTGVWNQVAVTFTTTNGSSGTVQLYLNGAQVGSQANEAWNLNQTMPMRFGAHAQSPSSSAPWFNGELAEIAMFKAALSPAQISLLTNHAVAYWGGGVATNRVTLNIVLPPPPPPPTLAALTNASLIAGQILSVTNSASDPSSPPQRLLFSLLTAPAGASINATSGVIAWRPTIAQSGTSNLFTVVVTQNGWLTNISALAAAYVRDGIYSNANYGASNTLAVKYYATANSGNTRESYLQFSVTNIPGLLASAKLQLTPLMTSFAGTHAVAWVTNDAWSQNTITWGNKPASGPALATWVPSVGTPAQADVTGAAAGQIAGDGLLSLRVFGTNQTANGLVTYGSIGGVATNAPLLIVISTNTTSQSATQSFWAGVIAPQRPLISAPLFSAGQFSLTLNGDTGPDYTIQGTTNLAPSAWQTLFTTNAPVLPFVWVENNTPNFPSRFYRVTLGP